MNHRMDQWNPIENNKKQLNFINAQLSTACTSEMRKCIEFWSSIDFIRLFIRFVLNAWMVSTKRYSVSINTHNTQRAININKKMRVTHQPFRCKNSFNVFAVVIIVFFFNLPICSFLFFYSVIVYSCTMKIITQTQKSINGMRWGRLNEARTQFR